jgi:Transposase C of IS166 homeodomain
MARAIFCGESASIARVTTPSDPLPTDLAAAHEMIVAQREMLRLARSELTISRLELERYKLLLAKARREQYGQSSERARHLIEQLELAIEDLEETRAAEEAEVAIAAPEAVTEKRAQPELRAKNDGRPSKGEGHQQEETRRSDAAVA